jgi:alpha-tubulin suppressor-like RCC1 family protein
MSHNNETEGVQIADMLCGWSHTIALTSTGTCLSWGGNDFGELGLGYAGGERVETPQRIAQLPKVCC